MTFMKRTHRRHQADGPVLLAANFARDGTHALTTIDNLHKFGIGSGLLGFQVLCRDVDIQLFSGVDWESIRFFARRIRSITHIVSIFADCIGNYVAKVGVWSGKASLLSERESQHVVKYEDLNITVNTGANTDGGNVDALSNQFRYFARHNFENDRECAGIFECFCIVDYLSGSSSSFPLDSICAKLVD